MTETARTLIVGLGSDHGDDRAGWLVAEQLTAIDDISAATIVRKAVIPLDLINWLDDVDTLHIADACEMDSGETAVRRFCWADGKLIPIRYEACCLSNGKSSEVAPDEVLSARTHLPKVMTNFATAEFESRHDGGSHDFRLPEVLQLAAATGQLPQRVFVWAIRGSAFGPGESVSDGTRLAIAETALQIHAAVRIEEPSHA